VDKSVDKVPFSVDKSVDNLGSNFYLKVIHRLSTSYSQVYPQDNYLIIKNKSDLSTDFSPLNNNKLKKIYILFNKMNLALKHNPKIYLYYGATNE
jgi:hypothetical protein